jgi:hypothetical protein
MVKLLVLVYRDKFTLCLGPGISSAGSFDSIT